MNIWEAQWLTINSQTGCLKHTGTFIIMGYKLFFIYHKEEHNFHNIIWFQITRKVWNKLWILMDTTKNQMQQRPRICKSTFNNITVYDGLLYTFKYMVQALLHNQQSYIQHFHGCLRTTVTAPFINKAPSQSMLIVGNLFLIVVNWKNAMGSSRLSTPTFSPTTHWALVRSWTSASGTIQDEMEENIDLEPQLHAMMCPDMAAWGSANSQMLLGSGPGAADTFAALAR